MRQRHAQIFLTHRHRVEPWPELVQSTDQTAHIVALGTAALFLAAI